MLQRHRIAQEVSLVFTVPNYRTDLQDVLAVEMQGARRPLLLPYKAGGAARVVAEVISLVAHRSENHARVGLRRNFTENGCTGERALQQSIADLPVMGNHRRGFVEVGIRRYRLRIEVVKTGVLQTVRSEMNARGQRLLGRQNGVKLGEGIEGGRLGQVLR